MALLRPGRSSMGANLTATRSAPPMWGTTSLLELRGGSGCCPQALGQVYLHPQVLHVLGPQPRAAGLLLLEGLSSAPHQAAGSGSLCSP